MELFELGREVGKALMTERLRTCGLNGLYVDDVVLLIKLADQIEDPVTKGLLLGALQAISEAARAFMQRIVLPSIPRTLH